MPPLLVLDLGHAEGRREENPLRGRRRPILGGRTRRAAAAALHAAAAAGTDPSPLTSARPTEGRAPAARAQREGWRGGGARCARPGLAGAAPAAAPHLRAAPRRPRPPQSRPPASGPTPRLRAAPVNPLGHSAAVEPSAVAPGAPGRWGRLVP